MKSESILITKDYNKFKLYKYNRGINEGLVRRLIDSINEIGYEQGKPILVDKDYAIIDGQHRFTACQRLDIEIRYMITKVDPEKAIINLNAQQVQWKISDYIHLYAEQGIKCYQHLKDFEERRKFGVTNSVYVLFNSNGMDSNDTKKIRAGHKFTINSKAETIAHFIKQCEIVPYYKSGNFVKAIVKLFKQADHKQLEKVKAGLISLPQQPTTVAYMIAFTNIVNRGIMGKNRITFN